MVHFKAKFEKLVDFGKNELFESRIIVLFFVI